MWVNVSVVTLRNSTTSMKTEKNILFGPRTHCCLLAGRERNIQHSPTVLKLGQVRALSAYNYRPSASGVAHLLCGVWRTLERLH